MVAVDVKQDLAPAIGGVGRRHGRGGGSGRSVTFACWDSSHVEILVKRMCEMGNVSGWSMVDG